MQRFPRYCLLTTALLASTLLTLSIGQRLGHRAAPPPALDDWDISQLTDHLNRAGLAVRLCPERKNGSLRDPSAYLTTTDKDWEELAHLFKNSSRIHEWRGTVFCRRRDKQKSFGTPYLGDHYLVAGPFVFYGDAELLERIRLILRPSAPPVAP